MKDYEYYYKWCASVDAKIYKQETKERLRNLTKIIRRKNNG